MRITKRIFAFVLVAVMLAASSVVVLALPSTPTSTTNGASYYEYTNKGASSGKSTTYNVIKFNTGDELIPMAYAANAGKTSSLQTHVNAAIAEGYEVIGAVNAAFFDMENGDPCADLISDGRIIYAHEHDADDILTTFDAEGNAKLVYSNLAYSLNINGNNISDAIGIINKDYTANSMEEATISTRFHYYDAKAGSLANSAQSGIELVCEKLNGTDIRVGETLQGKVLSVNKSSYYGKTQVTADNQFVLFVKSSSSMASYANVSAGATVALTVTETNSSAKDAMNNAHSAIGSTYWLVLDGKNLAAESAEIIHSTTYSRPWTAFGWDNNGNYYYITTEGEKATLRDVAAELVSLGCNYVLRLDGGGSTAMYVDGKGIVYNQGRNITDCLLIVKRPASLKLESAIVEAESLFPGDYSADADKYMIDAYEDAYAVYTNTSSTEAQYKSAYTKLTNAISYIKNANNFAGQEDLSEFVYITDFNRKVPTGGAVLITSDYCGGKLEYADTGLSYSYGIRCEYQSDGKYKVVERYAKYKEVVNLADDEILIVVHASNASKYASSKLNAANLQKIAVGEVITLNGIDVEAQRISACGYIDAQFSYVEDTNTDPGTNTDPNPDPDTNNEPDPDNDDYVLGDVNKSGDIDMMDYILLKRNYFGTFAFDAEQLKAGDCNKSGVIDMMDYILLKRAYFGTFVLA